MVAAVAASARYATPSTPPKNVPCAPTASARPSASPSAPHPASRQGCGASRACAGRTSRRAHRMYPNPAAPPTCSAGACGVAGLHTPMQPEAAGGRGSPAPVHGDRTGSPPPVTSLQSSEAATTGAAPRATAGDAASHAPAPSPASSALNSTSHLPPRAAVCGRSPGGAQGPARPAGPRLHRRASEHARELLIVSLVMRCPCACGGTRAHTNMPTLQHSAKTVNPAPWALSARSAVTARRSSRCGARARCASTDGPGLRRWAHA